MTVVKLALVELGFVVAERPAAQNNAALIEESLVYDLATSYCWQWGNQDGRRSTKSAIW